MFLYQRVVLIVLDSVGIGALPDADQYGDQGAHTLGHVAAYQGGLHLPHLKRLGLGNIEPIEGVPPVDEPAADFGRMMEASRGKDTTTGHWELMGIITEVPFKTYPDGFPQKLIRELESRIGRKVIGNYPASGTQIIEQLGQEHMETGSIIVYTSADSVLQIAAHEEIVPLEELYHICQVARELTRGEPYPVGRVIARPFVGEPGHFIRTANRRDFSVKPPQKTVLDHLKEYQRDVIALGKISDIFAGVGITRSVHTKSNEDGVDQLLKVLQEPFHGLAFLNLVDFDSKYGHRRDPVGYARALEAFDRRLPEILDSLRADDLLILTADHGNDPTHHGTDHTREFVPLLVYTAKKKCVGRFLGVRSTFADVGATIAKNFAVPLPDAGKSFLQEISG